MYHPESPAHRGDNRGIVTVVLDNRFGASLRGASYRPPGAAALINIIRPSYFVFPSVPAQRPASPPFASSPATSRASSHRILASPTTHHPFSTAASSESSSSTAARQTSSAAPP